MFHQVWLAPDDYHTLEFPWWPNNHLSKGPVDYLILLHLSWVRSYPEVGCRRRVEMPLYPILWQLVSDFCFIQLLKSLLNFSLSTDKFCSISRPNMRMLCDHIPPEAWKEGGLVSSKVLHSPLNKIWNEEVIPQDWKLGLLVKLLKKGDLSLCNNW